MYCICIKKTSQKENVRKKEANKLWFHLAPIFTLPIVTIIIIIISKGMIKGEPN